MKAEIDFQSTDRFNISFGMVLVTVAMLVGYLFVNYLGAVLKSFSYNMLFLVIFSGLVFLIYSILGASFVNTGYKGLKESEGLAKKMKFEQMVNQILDQDLKLIDIKLKQLEYNEKVRSLKGIDKSKALGIQDLNEVLYRDIPNVVAQALDTNYYEKIYPEIVKNITKKSGEMKNKKQAN
jgi:hypothetical protein